MVDASALSWRHQQGGRRARARERAQERHQIGALALGEPQRRELARARVAAGAIAAAIEERHHLIERRSSARCA